MRLLLFMVALVLCASAEAIPVRIVGHERSEISLDGYVEVLEDKSARMTMNDVLVAAEAMGDRDVRFDEATDRLLHPGYSRSSFWLRLEVVNESDKLQSLRLLLDSARLQEVDFLLRRGPDFFGAWDHSVAGTARPLSSHRRPFRKPLMYIDLAARDKALILVRVAGEGSIDITPRLYPTPVFRNVDGKQSVANGMLIGALMLLSAYSLLIGIFSPTPMLFWQAIGFATLALYEASSLGLAKTYIWPESLVWGARGQGVLDVLVVLVLMMYLRSVAGGAKSRIPGRTILLSLMLIQAGLGIGLLVGDYFIYAQASLFLLPLIAAAVCISSFEYMRRKGRVNQPVLLVIFLTFVILSTKSIDLLGIMPNTSPPRAGYGLGFFGTLVALTAFAIWFNRMALQRQRADERVIALQRRQQRQLELEISERTAELRKALADAEAMGQKQGRIMAYIGHDLRAPLATIVGYARLLHSAAGPHRARYANAIERGADYQLSLIDDLLEYATPNFRPLNIEPSPLHLQQLLGDIEQAAAALAARQNNRFILQKAEGPVWVRMDGKRLQQVLHNLLSNAAKFTRNGTITLLFNAKPFKGGWQLRFEVGDTGIGIAEEDRLRIFNRFEQARQGGNGLGLGLFIAKRIVEGMGGVLNLHSVPGEGSCFFFEVSVPAEEMPGSDSHGSPSNGHLAAQRAVTRAGVSSEAGETACPPAEDLHELARLAEQGAWSEIGRWLDRLASSRPECRDYLVEVDAALRALDFERIARLATQGLSGCRCPSQ